MPLESTDISYTAEVRTIINGSFRMVIPDTIGTFDRNWLVEVSCTVWIHSFITYFSGVLDSQNYVDVI